MALARVAERGVEGRLRDPEASARDVEAPDLERSHYLLETPTLGFADQVAEEVRDRSRTADAVVERTTRRLLRRRPRMDPPTGPLPNPGTS